MPVLMLLRQTGRDVCLSMCLSPSGNELKRRHHHGYFTNRVHEVSSSVVISGSSRNSKGVAPSEGVK